MNDTKLAMFLDEQLDDVKKAFRDDDLIFAINRLDLLRSLLVCRQKQAAQLTEEQLKNNL